MIGEDPKNPNPDSFWHRVTWSGARRNAQRSANSKSNLGYDSQVYKNSDVWSVRGQRTRDDGTTLTTSHYAASFDNNGEVFSKSWSFSTQTPEPVPMDYTSSSEATISSPSPFQGKSHFDIVMVDTNPIMPAIAGAVAPPLGVFSGLAQATSDFSDGNYVGAALGLLTTGYSIKSFGPARNWVMRGEGNNVSLRPGETYSKTLNAKTIGYKWGAGGSYIKQIPHYGNQWLNMRLRKTPAPFKDGLGLQEGGHYHLRTR